ncbi:MAG: Flp pilus assembly complex ATPase component TadA, partial [Actinomycetales bacterium]|nr:Flp pilus assembly complex ATPase component TadA [Actinomycetales bacterium]
LSPKGTCISIRIPQAQLLTLAELNSAKMLNQEALGVLKQVIVSGLSFMICGGTGSGKTTLLAALLAEVNARQRILVIEDTNELKIVHPHVVSLQARGANTEGAGEVSLRELVRQALRMRPDRLILGEVRGVEIVDLVNALNTGHAGGCATIHANSAKDVPSRIISLGLLAGVPTVAMQQLFATAIQLIVELVQLPSGRRLVARLQLVELVNGSVQIQPAFDWLTRNHDEVGISKFAELVRSSLQ